jgi:DNA topoisomerase-3
LISEHKGTLALTPCGEVSFVLLDGCHIASPEATEQLFESMQKVGCFEEDPTRVLNTVTQMVVHDRDVMTANKTKLSGLKGLGAPTVGTCPLCGEALLDKGRSLQCTSNKFKKEADGGFTLISGCGFRMFKSAFGKKLTDTQIKQLLANGSTNTKVKGLTSQKTGQKFNAILALDKQTGRIMPVFDK